MATKKTSTKKVRGNSGNTKEKSERIVSKGKSNTNDKMTATGKTTKTAEAPNRAKPISGLDAAAQVLVEAGGSMSSRQIVDIVLSKKLWKTNGKTPHATIYAAIIRDIQKKGSKSRFEKVSHGKFTIRK